METNTIYRMRNRAAAIAVVILMAFQPLASRAEEVFHSLTDRKDVESVYISRRLLGDSEYIAIKNTYFELGDMLPDYTGLYSYTTNSEKGVQAIESNLSTYQRQHKNLEKLVEMRDGNSWHVILGEPASDGNGYVRMVVWKKDASNSGKLAVVEGSGGKRRASTSSTTTIFANGTWVQPVPQVPQVPQVPAVSTGGSAREIAEEARRQAAEARAQAAKARDEAAKARDEAAKARERAAQKKEKAAKERERAAQEREKAQQQRDKAYNEREKAYNEREKSGKSSSGSSVKDVKSIIASYTSANSSGLKILVINCESGMIVASYNDGSTIIENTSRILTLNGKRVSSYIYNVEANSELIKYMDGSSEIQPIDPSKISWSY